MRHGNKINHLGRKYGHRRALLANLASALITHKRIITTVAKAKELRRYIEPLITKAKDNSTHSRRIVFGYLQDKVAVKELFDVVAGKIANRPGGYVRIIRFENRAGDNAETAFIELVDFNEIYTAEGRKTQTPKAKRTRRSGGSAKPKDTEEVPAVKPVAPVAEEVAETEVEEVVPVAEPETEDVATEETQTEENPQIVAEVQEEEAQQEEQPETPENTDEQAEEPKA